MVLKWFLDIYRLVLTCQAGSSRSGSTAQLVRLGDWLNPVDQPAQANPNPNHSICRGHNQLTKPVLPLAVILLCCQYKLVKNIFFNHFSLNRVILCCIKCLIFLYEPMLHLVFEVSKHSGPLKFNQTGGQLSFLGSHIISYFGEFLKKKIK